MFRTTDVYRLKLISVAKYFTKQLCHSTIIIVICLRVIGVIFMSDVDDRAVEMVRPFNCNFKVGIFV